MIKDKYALLDINCPDKNNIHSPATLLGTPIQLLGNKLLIIQSHGSNSMHLRI